MTLTIEGSTLTENRAGYEGGGVSVGGQGTCHVHIEGTDWSENFANYAGGALLAGGWEDDTLEIEGGSFVGNRSNSSGGAIEAGGWGDQTARLEGVAFTGNESEYAAVSLGGRDGAMDAVVEGGSFDGNVSVNGAALAHARGRLQVIEVDFGTVAANTPADAWTPCGTQILGGDASFTCDNGVWSSP